MRKMSSLVCGFLFSSLCQVGFAEAIKVETPRGIPLEVIAEFPPGSGPFPVVILAPGQGYHMALPAIEQTANQLIDRGVAVFRFNWAYYSKDPKSGRPAKDLAAEIEDMSTVVTKARSDSRIARGNMFAAGKSLGSIVAWKILAANKDFKGGLFLTPICSRVPKGSSVPVPEGDERYPNIASERRPLAFISGELDPLCAAPVLYRFAANAGGPTRVSIVGGDHGFKNPTIAGSAGDELALRNAKLAAILSADFVAEFARH
jgi:predicted alpha/beta-hydrolase family hydrolase